MATPKYEKVKTYLIDFIQSSDMRYGDSMPTESELMKMFDVSRHTIRRALSDLVNQGLAIYHARQRYFCGRSQCGPEAYR